MADLGEANLGPDDVEPNGAPDVSTFRGVHVGDVVAWFGEGDLIAAAFHHHANQAHWHTVSCLLRLGGQKVDGTASAIIGCVEWWRTIESAVALLHALALRESEQGLRPTLDRLDEGRGLSVMAKWSRVVGWYTDGTAKAPPSLNGRMSELRDFRNAFEHTSWGETRAREHSRLCEVPALANELDIMEALAICLEFFDYIRGVVPGVDLMPEVLIPSVPTLFFEDLERVARELVLPLFSGAIASRGMATDFAFYDAPGRIPGAAQSAFQVLIRSVDERPLPDVTGTWNPVDVLDTYGRAHPRRPADEGFGLPNYVAR